MIIAIVAEIMTLTMFIIGTIMIVIIIVIMITLQMIIVMDAFRSRCKRRFGSNWVRKQVCKETPRLRFRQGFGLSRV